MGKKHEAESGRDRIETGVVKGKSGHIASLEGDVQKPKGLRLATGNPEHLLRQIETDDPAMGSNPVGT
jgi:hypothetical protein